VGSLNDREDRSADAQDRQKQALDKQLETIGWGLFLIMIGGIGLVPQGVWLIGVGLIMLGLNAARYVHGIKTSNLTIVLGILALLSGLGDLLGVELPVFAIVLILLHQTGEVVPHSLETCHRYVSRECGIYLYQLLTFGISLPLDGG